MSSQFFLSSVFQGVDERETKTFSWELGSPQQLKINDIVEENHNATCIRNRFFPLIAFKEVSCNSLCTYSMYHEPDFPALDYWR
jgi:hypothetical protein